MPKRRQGTLVAGVGRAGAVDYCGDTEDAPATYPVPITGALHTLCSRMGVLEALGHGDGRGALVITGRCWRDTSHMPDPDEPSQGPPGRVDLLSASAARAAGIAIFAKVLLAEIDEKIERFLGEKEEGEG